MYKVTVNKNNSYIIKNEKNGWNVGKKLFFPDLKQISFNTFHLILNGNSYRIQYLHGSAGMKNAGIYVNGNFYEVAVKDKYDQLLSDLGIEDQSGKKSGPVKSPMPGKVLEVKVKSGEEVNAGDALIILEAMKMENVIKASAAGTVQEVMVATGDSVEKNQVLIDIA